VCSFAFTIITFMYWCLLTVNLVKDSHWKAFLVRISILIPACSIVPKMKQKYLPQIIFLCWLHQRLVKYVVTFANVSTFDKCIIYHEYLFFWVSIIEQMRSLKCENIWHFPLRPVHAKLLAQKLWSGISPEGIGLESLWKHLWIRETGIQWRWQKYTFAFKVFEKNLFLWSCRINFLKIFGENRKTPFPLPV